MTPIAQSIQGCLPIYHPHSSSGVIRCLGATNLESRFPDWGEGWGRGWGHQSGILKTKINQDVWGGGYAPQISKDSKKVFQEK